MAFNCDVFSIEKMQIKRLEYDVATKSLFDMILSIGSDGFFLGTNFSDS